MAFDTTLLTDYSWADIAKAAKTAMMHAAVGGTTMSISGRTIGRLTVEEARKLYETAIEMQQIEANSEQGGGIALVKFGEAQ